MAWKELLRDVPDRAPVGAEVDPYPYISGFGLLTRMTRLGALTGPEITGLGFRNRSTIDVQLTTQLLRTPAQTMLVAAGLAASRVAEFWPLECWSPSRLGGLLDSPRPLKQCTECAAHGYHSTLFQMPSIHRCPWHNIILIHACPICSRPFWSRFGKLGRLGGCDCGLDLFDPSVASVEMWDFPTEAADQWASQYLEWAAAERELRWIAVHHANTALESGIAQLAQPPKHLQLMSSIPSGPVEEFASEGEEPCSGAFWGWLQLGEDPRLTYAPLPADLQPMLVAATHLAIDAFPGTTSTPLQLVALGGFGAGHTLQQNVANQPECFIAPHGFVTDGPTWLNLSAVDRASIQACRAALDGAITGLDLDLSAVDCSPQVLRSQALDEVSGRRHLASALAAIVVQGYRQGLEAILRSLVDAQTQPTSRWVTPIVEFRRQQGGLAMVRICWVASKPQPRKVPDVPESVPCAKRKRGPRSTGRSDHGQRQRKGSKSGAVSPPTR